MYEYCTHTNKSMRRDAMQNVCTTSGFVYVFIYYVCVFLYVCMRLRPGVHIIE